MPSSSSSEAAVRDGSIELGRDCRVVRFKKSASLILINGDHFTLPSASHGIQVSSWSLVPTSGHCLEEATGSAFPTTGRTTAWGHEGLSVHSRLKAASHARWRSVAVSSAKISTEGARKHDPICE